MPMVPVVLCGGVGSRLWPVSRQQQPKPFIIMGDGYSLFQQACLRAARLPGVSEVVVSIHQDLFSLASDHIARLHLPTITFHYCLEPASKNTAAAVAIAALHIQQHCVDNAVMLVLSADHIIADFPAFCSAVEAASALALDNEMVTFGIQPNYPETGYGYLHYSGNKVLAFVEKPCLEDAQRYLASGNYLWNAGMFCFTVATVLGAFTRYAERVLTLCQACVSASSTKVNSHGMQLICDSALFAEVADISIDFALMEKADNLRVIACDIGWSDMGSWLSMGQLSAADGQGNRVKHSKGGAAFMVNTSNCIVQTCDRTLGLVGLNNIIVIDTPDATLIADASQAQAVKNLYAQLQQHNNPTYQTHITVQRQWGYYRVLTHSDTYKVKKLVVNPQASLSLQHHQHRSEHWTVVCGTATVINNGLTSTLVANQSVFIAAGHLHKLINTTDENLEIIEVQCGAYLGEDDIVRHD